MNVCVQGTKAEGTIQNLFVGKMKSFIKCVNVDFESSRIEEFNGKWAWLTLVEVFVNNMFDQTSNSTSRV